VKDTGVGIPPDQLEKIFEAFHQIGEKRLAQTKGIGLGLTVSQRLAWMMGSDLHAESTLQQGSHFWFDIPLALESPERYQIQQSATTQADPPRKQIVPPANPQLCELHELACAGDLMALNEYGQLLKQNEPDLAAFADTLIEMVGRIEIEEIQDFLKRYLDA
jgi:hypothetical protein